MKLKYMRGGQLKESLAKNLPLVIPAGVIEYHGQHLGLGCDTIVVEKTLELLEKKIPMVIAPAFNYGPASFAVAGPEFGTIDADNNHLGTHIKDVLWGFLNVGFKKIIVVIHHQYEQGTELPLALAFKKAAAELVFKYLEEKEGRGWWGNEKNKEFYDKLDTDQCPWNWIKVIPLMSAEVQNKTGYDHAGKHESSLLWALCPEAVDMDKRSDNNTWYTKEAENASVEYGKQIIELIIEQLSKVIR